MTLDQVATIPKNFLTPADVAPYLHTNPQDIRVLAHEGKLLFPVQIVGNRVKIPKELFVQTFDK